MKKTKKLTLAAMMSALGTVFLLIGAHIEAFDLMMGVIASVVMIFVYIELGSPYTWLVWISTSLLAALLGTANLLSAIWYFTLFGIWPVLKGYIERLPCAVWLIPKILYANAAFFAVIGGWSLIFGTSPFAIDAQWLKITALVLGNVAFIAYDMFVTVIAKLYLVKYRKRFSKFLK